MTAIQTIYIFFKSSSKILTNKKENKKYHLFSLCVFVFIVYPTMILVVTPQFAITWLSPNTEVSTFAEGDYSQTLKYQIELLNPNDILKYAGQYIRLDPMYDPFIDAYSVESLRKNFDPSSCIYYHPSRIGYDCFYINIDVENEGIQGLDRGMRYYGASSFVWNVTLKWWKNRSPEITDRSFTIVHVVCTQIKQ